MDTDLAPPTDDGAFVGRAPELARLVALLDRARAGRGGIALIAGEPGIGKTRLAEEFARRAIGRGARVFWGRCHEGEGAPAFWPWTQVLRSLLAGEDGATLVRALGPDATDLAQLLPELRAGPPEPSPSPLLSPEQARFRLFDTVRRLVSIVGAGSREPGAGNALPSTPHQHPAPGSPLPAPGLVIILDDLHWADTPSLLLLQFLARELRSLPVLLLGTYRDGEAESGRPLAESLAILARVEGISQRTLRGLSAPDVAEFLDALLGASPPADVVESVTDRTEGNPFFVGELARLLAADADAARPFADGGGPVLLPPGARAVLDQRLAGLSPACLQILETAAVIGRDFGLDLLVRLPPAETNAALDALEEAEAARVIAPLPGPAARYRFAHALIRETLYARLPAARRLRLHRQVCEALEQHYGTNRDEHLAELAHHAQQSASGGDAAKAVDYARRAGDQALARLAYEEAARQYRLALQALDLSPAPDPRERATLLLDLGEAQNAAGDTGAAEATFTDAAAAARAAGASALLARAALGFGGERIGEAGFDPRRGALLDEALTALEDGAGEGALGGTAERAIGAEGAPDGDGTPEDEGRLRVRLLTRLSEALRAPADLARRRALSEAAVALARRLDDPRTLVAALSARCAAHWGPEGSTALAAAVGEMLALAERVGDPALALQGQHWRILDLLARGALPEADAAIADFGRLAEAQRDPFRRWQAAALRVIHPQLEGRFAEAEALAAEARAVGERVNRSNADDIFHHQVSTGRTLREGWAGSIPRLAAITARYPQFPAWRASLTVAYADTGQEEEARRELDRLAADDFAALRRAPLRVYGFALLARACALLGDRPRAAFLYAQLEPLAGGVVFVPDGLIWHAAIDYWLGLLAATLGRPEAAERHFEAALALYARNGAAVWAARAQHAYAAMLLERRGPGDDERARVLLGQALSTANRLAMPFLAEQVRRLREEASERPARLAALPDGLTEREGEVLRLLAAGKSNQAIAVALVLSVRTVERHLTNLYPKIGAHNRADAAAYAVRHDLA